MFARSPIRFQGNHASLIRRFSRSARWRRAFLAASLPYLLVSVLVDFVHVHAPAGPGASAAERAITLPVQRTVPRADYTCTACLWLRTGLQLVASARARLSAQACTSDFVLPAFTVSPDSPASRPALLRGPPFASLS